MPKMMAGVVAAALLAVAGCGDDGDEASASGDAWELPGEFCADAEVVRDRYSELDELDADSARAAFDNLADAIRRVTPADEIAADWEILAALYDDDEAAEASDGDALVEASINVDAYLREECGFSFDASE